jgi:hypothetical protein
MEIYVHTSPGMGFQYTRMGVSVYRSLKQAIADGHSQATLEDHTLHGTLNGTVVFAAHKYDPGPDMHDLVGIYADRDSAEQAAGDRGMILSLKLS